MNRLALIGGISAVGKSTLCRLLSEKSRVLNKRLHHYIFNVANEEGISDLSANWDSLAKEAVSRLCEDTFRMGPISCDIHFAVQPNLDTAYAQGLDFQEDINEEEYIRGLNSFILQGFSGRDVSLYAVLLEADPEEILHRRRMELEVLGKKPRSLNLSSIEREGIYERKYFEETVDELKPLVELYVERINNGNLQKSFKEISSFMGVSK